MRYVCRLSGRFLAAVFVGDLAGQTGGEVVEVGDGDALEQVVGNLMGRYSLGFVPDEKDLDGRFHKLKVKIKDSVLKSRKLKPTLRARSGYYAKKEAVSY